MSAKISVKEKKANAKLVARFNEKHHLLSAFLDQVLASIKSSQELMKIHHSLKWRIKDGEHLRDKLERKILEYKNDGKSFDIDADNLFLKINDLAGVRILHIHTRQMREIHNALMQVFEIYRYRLFEPPSARTWDDESRAFFQSIGIETRESGTLYTSVHYVILSNSNEELTCEIQVRTLMEEVWGEVDHTINYPYKTQSVACKEQIRALARSTSAATRLVDAIFASHDDYAQNATLDALRAKKGRR